MTTLIQDYSLNLKNSTIYILYNGDSEKEALDFKESGLCCQKYLKEQLLIEWIFKRDSWEIVVNVEEHVGKRLESVKSSLASLTKELETLEKFKSSIISSNTIQSTGKAKTTARVKASK